MVKLITRNNRLLTLKEQVKLLFYQYQYDQKGWKLERISSLIIAVKFYQAISTVPICTVQIKYLWHVNDDYYVSLPHFTLGRYLLGNNVPPTLNFIIQFCYIITNNGWRQPHHCGANLFPEPTESIN